jgi:hypothetical protein
MAELQKTVTRAAAANMTVNVIKDFFIIVSPPIVVVIG